MNIVVIGGGAAGFFGAIACAEANPQARVTILEAGSEPLAKVRISGGGRCNVTHSCFEPAQLVQHYPRGGKALRGAFSRFQPKDTIAWFAARGVVLKTEADGRMFPTTDDSETIVNCLMESARRAGVQLYTGSMVQAVERDGDKFGVQLRQGKPLWADRLLVAAGSGPIGRRIASSLGHSIVEAVPSLFTFNIKDPVLNDLGGVSVPNVKVRLLSSSGEPALEQQGPLLVTHWGLSGPAVLKLSAWGARRLHGQQYQADLVVNWLPSLNAEQLRDRLNGARQEFPRRQLGNYVPIELPQRLWLYLLDRSGLSVQSLWADISKKAINALILEISQGSYRINGKSSFKDEFVTCGGVDLKGVDFKTLESRHCPGLYFAGEVLDIDGVTGGFNFQSAWTTGWLAGQAMAQI
jgi:predicted Rossmann fold flavoprotein